jgi:hypothetical protein
MASADSTGRELPPVAPLLMQSLRAVGYTSASAVADLIDNSIAARATKVAIRFSFVPEPLVAIVDDGVGMHRETLVSAMRFGSRDPRATSLGPDLGRFGLGLKTASLSQCRRLTVASLRNGSLSVAVWDLDECERRGQWWLGTPGAEAVPDEVIEALQHNGHGTAVVWHDLDRIASTGGTDSRRNFELTMNDIADHLAMVFHRFLAGDIAGVFDITVNGRSLPRLDPFLEGHSRGQALHGETFLIEDHPVSVSPFVLPFPSRLKPTEIERVGGRESLKTGHGFYVYRGGRLVVPGGWFRIVPSDELIRLARVRVDMPVELDHLWKVDIRKTMAEPPAALRPDLKRIVGAVTLRSRKVYTFKGNAKDDADRVPLWVRNDGRDGAASWCVNREHPLIKSLDTTRAAEVEPLLSVMERHLPLHDIYLHISNDLPVAELPQPEYDHLEALAQRLLAAFAHDPELQQRVLDRLPVTEPFSADPDTARRLAEALRP